MWLFTACVAWLTFHTQPLNSTLTYYVPEPFCDDVLPGMWEDRMLSFHTIDCAWVRRHVRSAFDAWQYNTPLRFDETVYASNASIVLHATDLEIDVLGRAWSHTTPARLEIDTSGCWYADGAFCHSVDPNVILPLFVVAWVSSGISVVGILLVPFDRIDGVVRLVAWSVFISSPLLYWGAFAPCTQCNDFTTTVVHEIGHLIGLGHSDVDGQWCGCGADAAPCAGDHASRPIMWSTISHRAEPCPDVDDVNGARTLHGGSCSDPVFCYSTNTHTGFARVAVALVYAFAVSWAIVCVRNTACLFRRRSRPVPVPVPVPPPRPVPPAPSQRPLPRRPLTR